MARTALATIALLRASAASLRAACVACIAFGAVLPGCAHDVVLPNVGTESVCGNGVVDQGEACDTTSAGCVDCQVAAGWVCKSNVCTQPCGDGVVGTGPDCADPHRDTDCDMTGYWAASETDYTCDDTFHAPQTSSNWYLYHLVQQGNDFQVDAELDCGVHVTGSGVTTDYTPPALDAMMYLNAMDGTGSHPARRGTSQATSGGCSVTLDRWYLVRGVDETFLPATFSTDVPLASLPSLPVEPDPINGPDVLLPGATDPDGDGFDGVALRITGIVTGVRDSAQRDWKQFATTGAPVQAAALRFDVPGSFDLEEHILHVSQCGSSCGLLTTGTTVSTAPGKITFKFIGKTLDSFRVSAVVTAQPRQSLAADHATCANVRQQIAHETTAPADACPASSSL